jgi:hypothetical protein
MDKIDKLIEIIKLNGGYINVWELPFSFNNKVSRFARIALNKNGNLIYYKERYEELKRFKPTQKHLEEILDVVIIKNLDLFENS